MTEPSPLELLPHDVLRRVVDTVDTGGPSGSARTPLKTALILSQVSRRLRAYVFSSYLPSILSMTHQEYKLVSGSDTRLRAIALEALLARCTGLRKFSSSGAPPGLVTSNAVLALATAARDTIEEVDIKFIDVVDDAVRPLFGCPKLRRLEMSFGRDVTRNLFDFTPGESIRAPLEYLDLTWVACVDERAVKHVADIGTLKELYLKGCEGFKMDAAEVLIAGKAASSLETLSVCYCPLDNTTLKNIIKSLPRLTKCKVAVRSGVHFLDWAYDMRGIEEARTEFQHVRIELDA